MAGEQLKVSEGKDRGKPLTVDAELLIGRSAPQDEGKLGGDPEISRRHARLARDADGLLTVEDLGSANGTFVNGERIDARRTLDPGDVVRMGLTILEVTRGPAAAPSRPQPPAPTALHEADVPADAGEGLVVTSGAAPGRRLEVGDELVIGRTAEGPGRLSGDRELSRRHARLARDANGRLTIEDLGSANGTFVNGELVRERRVLSTGDSVRVGSTTMELTGAGRAPAPPPAARPAPPAPAARPPVPAASPAPASDVTTDRRQVAAELRPGTVFAGCRVEEVIGRGDMGIVYRAEELSLQRRVALKQILPEHSAEERFRERFRRESRVAASIDHPNVIPILDAGDEEGALYITMSLVEGTDLRALIAAEGATDPLRAARIVRQVGAALDAAHARGLLHRDVKPPNVLLGREDHVYLSDFGLAKRAQSVGGLTRQGSIVARAEYVAPEQILNERVDARADIYALGCLLFEALTGEAPFARWKEGPAQLAHLNAPRPAPSELRPGLPREFDDVVRRAMARDPGERYPSAGDLGQDALVAAGGLRRAGPQSVVATGDAAPFGPGAEPPGHPRSDDGEPAGVSGEAAERDGADTLRWAIALAGLAIVAIGMVAALAAISSL